MTPEKSRMSLRPLLMILPAVLAAGLFVAVVSSRADADEFGEDWMNFGNRAPVERQSRPAARKATGKEIEQFDPVPLVSEVALTRLLRAERKYERLVRAGGWRKIPAGELLVAGSVSPRVSLLRQRLRRTGDMRRQTGFTNRFTPAVEKAVRRFQKRHGLRVNGRVNKHTLDALNVSAAQRLRQIRLNRQKLESQLENGLPMRFVMVNIADSTLEAVENNRVAGRHKVIVGKPQFQTPVLKASIVELNFYPYWHVPDSIARRDILPRLAKSLDYLRENRTRVYDKWGGRELDPASIDWQSPEALKYKFRQDPGPDNALGVLRINMPNNQAVYLHDTPMKKLFSSTVRAYSAGCVRVQNIDRLATWLLAGNEGWGLDRVRNVMQSGESASVVLKTRTPVYFSYYTAFVPSSGIVQFRRDIYDLDRPGEQQTLASSNLSSARPERGRIE